MDQILYTGFEKITHNIIFQPQSEPKGIKLVESHHVSDVKECRLLSGKGIITGKLTRQTDVLKETYSVKLMINADRFITEVQCSCAYGLSVRCKHVAAVIQYVNNEESLTKTDFDQEWGKPGTRQFTKTKYSKGRYYNQMFPHSRKQIVESVPPRADELRENSSLRIVLQHMTKDKVDSAIELFMKSAVKNIPLNMTIENCKAVLNSLFIFMEEYTVYRAGDINVSQELRKFFNERISLTKDKIQELCCDTIKQSQNNKWLSERKLRITASKNVHSIKSRQKKDIESLVNDILTNKSVNTGATTYGLRTEANARKFYQQTYNVSVKIMGLLVSPYQPWLGVSLDGVVIYKNCEVLRIVELKCPFSCKEKPIVDYSTAKCNVDYLEFKNGDIELKKSHFYYTQCQVQMYVSGVCECDLFIYTPVENGSCCVRVLRDEIFLGEVIPFCEKFYFTSYLPALKDNIENCSGKKENTRKFTGLNLLNTIKMK